MKSKRTTKKLTKKEREAVLRKRHIQTALFWVVPAVAPLVLWLGGVSDYTSASQQPNREMSGDIMDSIILTALVWAIISLKYSLFLLVARSLRAKLKYPRAMTVVSSIILCVTTVFDMGVLLFILMSPSPYSGLAVFFFIQYSLPFMLGGIGFMFLIYRLCIEASKATKVVKKNKRKAGIQYEDGSF